MPIIKRTIAGCLYRNPEADDTIKQNRPPSYYRDLRVWQVKEMCNQLQGIPIRLNHQTTGEITTHIDIKHADGSITPKGSSTYFPNSIWAGSKPIGTVLFAWVNKRKNHALHWFGSIEYESDATLEDGTGPILHDFITNNRFNFNSLQHQHIYPKYNFKQAVPLEVSLCHKPERQDASVLWDEKHLLQYMRNTNMFEYIQEQGDMATTDAAATAQAAQPTSATTTDAPPPVTAAAAAERARNDRGQFVAGAAAATTKPQQIVDPNTGQTIDISSMPEDEREMTTMLVDPAIPDSVKQYLVKQYDASQKQKEAFAKEAKSKQDALDAAQLSAKHTAATTVSAIQNILSQHGLANFTEKTVSDLVAVAASSSDPQAAKATSAFVQGILGTVLAQQNTSTTTAKRPAPEQTNDHLSKFLKSRMGNQPSTSFHPQNESVPVASSFQPQQQQQQQQLEEQSANPRATSFAQLAAMRFRTTSAEETDRRPYY